MSAHSLPAIVPVFPLSGVLLLPGMFLPLHIFEPRYSNMVADAQDGDGHIAMVQPVVPRQDNRPPPGAQPENPEIYAVGCVGWIERCNRTSDGRYTIELKGISRYRSREELPLCKGYRRVVADYGEFPHDAGADEEEFNTARLTRAVERFWRSHQIPCDLKKLDAVPGADLLNGLAMSLPFGPAEKQALLEAPRPKDRERILLDLIGMGLDANRGDSPFPPTLN